MEDVVPVISGLTVGAYFNAMLYMLEICQLTSYIKHYWKRDQALIKVVVILCFIADTLCTIATFVWVMMVIFPTYPSNTGLHPPTSSAPPLHIVGALVQSFLISRYYILSSRCFVSLILGFLMFTARAGGLSVAIILIVFASYTERDKPIISTMVWLLSSCLADILIALFLVLALSRASTGSMIQNTKSLISRLIFVAIQSGTVTTILALLVLTTYLVSPASNNPAYFSFCLGHAYTLTMLFNLNLRRSLNNRCYVCGMNMLGISLVSDAVTGVAEGALGTTKTVDVSEDVRHLPGLQVHQAKLPLRVDEREQTSFEGEECRCCKRSESERALSSSNTA